MSNIVPENTAFPIGSSRTTGDQDLQKDHAYDGLSRTMSGGNLAGLIIQLEKFIGDWPLNFIRSAAILF
jgi:hypothetical protein